MQRGRSEALQLDQIFNGFLRRAAMLRDEQRLHRRGVEADTRLIDDQVDGIQVGAQAGLQYQGAVDRVFKRGVSQG